MRTGLSVRLFVVGVVGTLCMCTPGFAAIDMFLKIPGITGESKLEQGAIDVTGYAYDVNSPREAGSGLATGRRQHKPLSFTDLSFSKPLDKASPLLMKACVEGQGVGEAVLTCRKSGGGDYLKVTMQDCIVSSFQSSGDPGDETSIESFSISFSHVDFEFIFPPTQEGGEPVVVKVSYDLKMAKK